MQLRGSTVRRPSCEGRTLNAFLGCAFSRDEAEADELDVLILLGRPQVTRAARCRSTFLHDPASGTRAAGGA